ncbi:unnamed protein product [Sphagnum troendelagicum]|uniref:Uncharacterized protein n=1 Tax=Sphagnum troendelagicum TaxID=128251 RepID=A0ABP0U708_9BRYO
MLHFLLGLNPDGCNMTTDPSCNKSTAMPFIFGTCMEEPLPWVFEEVEVTGPNDFKQGILLWENGKQLEKAFGENARRSFEDYEPGFVVVLFSALDIESEMDLGDEVSREFAFLWDDCSFDFSSFRQLGFPSVVEMMGMTVVDPSASSSKILPSTSGNWVRSSTNGFSSFLSGNSVAELPHPCLITTIPYSHAKHLLRNRNILTVSSKMLTCCVQQSMAGVQCARINCNET